MSDVVNSGSAAPANGSADAVVTNENQSVESNQVAGSASDQMTEAFKKRLQADLVKQKKQNADLALQLERERQARLEAQGDLSSVNDSLKKQLAEAQEKQKNIALGVKDFVVEMTVNNLATEYGCSDVETVMKYVNLDEIETDGVRVNVDQVKNFMDDMRKRKPDLFKKSNSSPRIGTPLSGSQASTTVNTQPKVFDPRKASAQEIADQIKSQFGRKQQ